jgi:ankyrin repeat protein
MKHAYDRRTQGQRKRARISASVVDALPIEIVAHVTSFLPTSYLHDDGLCAVACTSRRFCDAILLAIKPNKLLFYACENNHADVVNYLIDQGYIDFCTNRGVALEWSSRYGHAAIVERLLGDPRVDPAACSGVYDDLECGHAIGCGARNGHIDVVKLLLSDTRTDPATCNNYALRTSSAYGRADVVHLLLGDSRVDPAAEDNEAVRCSSECGHADVVRLLLVDRRVDPAAFDNYAIRFSTMNKHADVVKLLLEDGRVDVDVHKRLSSLTDCFRCNGKEKNAAFV